MPTTKTRSKSHKPKKSSSQIAEETTQRVLDLLEEGTVPWHRPWAIKGGHFSFASKRPYRGINQFLLDLTALSKGYSSRWWITADAAKKESQRIDDGTWRGVQKDEKATYVIVSKKSTYEDEKDLDENGKPKVKSYYYYNERAVFNFEQTKLPAPDEGEDAPDFEPIEEAERLLAEMVDMPKVNHGGDAAWYMPSMDRVQVPEFGQFESAEDYYCTVYHELGHATGHETRLSRDGITKLTSDTRDLDTYAYEELVAEMTAAITSGFVGIDVKARHETTAAYIASWMRKLAEPKNKRVLLMAASQAHKATDYILGIEGEENGNGN